MIQEIYQIGKLTKDINKTKLDDKYMPDYLTNIEKVIYINFNKKGFYINVKLYDFNDEEQYLYLVRKIAAKGNDFGPSVKISDVNKSLKNKIISWFKKSSQYKPICKQIYNELEEKKLQIVDEVKKLIKNSKLKQNLFLMTVCIDGKLPYQIDWLVNMYCKMIENKIFDTKGKIGTCYLCNKKGVDIVQEYGAYKFFTKDKPGFVSGGFNVNDFWRNCPVCVKCQPKLNIGRMFSERYLKYKYYNFDYYIIPSIIGKGKALEEIISILSTNLCKMQIMSKDSKTEFEIDNENIVYTLRDVGDINSFRLVFIKPDQAAERIILDIKDVYSSRFKEMYEAKDKLDRQYKHLMSIEDKDKNLKQVKFNFSFYREFLSKSDDKNRHNDLDQIFLNLTEVIFNKEKIKVAVILPYYLKRIRKLLNARNIENELKLTILKAIIGIHYLTSVGCLEFRKEETMNTKYDEIFKAYNCGLNTDIKKALVLVGALTQKVIDIQYYRIKSGPFYKNLKSLRLRQEDVKELITKCSNKMIEYNKYGIKSREITNEVFKLVLRSPNNWNLSIEEINFYIAAGMALKEEIYGDEKEDKEENDNEKE